MQKERRQRQVESLCSHSTEKPKTLDEGRTFFTLAKNFPFAFRLACLSRPTIPVYNLRDSEVLFWLARIDFSASRLDGLDIVALL